MREATEEELSRADKLNETLEKLTAIMEEAKKTPQKVNIVADDSNILGSILEKNTPTMNERLEKLVGVMVESMSTPQKVNIVADNSGEQNTPTRPSNSEWWRKKTLNEQINQAISGDGTGMR